MANTYYEAGNARAGRVRDLFADVALRYDLINDLQSFGLHRLWKRKLAQLARIAPGERALDVCCGTGDIAFALRNSGAAVIGLDFSVPMLRVARARRRMSRGPALDARHSALGCSERAPAFLCGDAQRLPFEDNAFEAVTVGYGLRNLASWQRGLQEMWRVAKPGGRLLVLDFGKPANAFWRALYFSYLRAGVPIFGRLFCRNAPAYAYIYESLQHYPAQQGVADHMRQLGCREVRVIQFLAGAMSINAAIK